MTKYLSLLALSVMVLSTAANATEAKKPSAEQCAKAKSAHERTELGCPTEAGKAQ